MNINCLEVFFFDMGNTLLNFHVGKSDREKNYIGLKGLQKYLNQELQINYSMIELKEQFFDRLENHMIKNRKKLGYEVEVEVFLSTIVKEELLSKEIVLEMSRIFYSQYIEEVVEEEWALKVLAELKNRGKKIGIISNCFLPDEVYIEIFRDKGLDEYIDAYFFSYSNKYMKPRHELFQRALKYFNVKPQKTIMIGDNYSADICPAKELSMNTCLYDNIHKQVNYSGLKINSLGEIFKWM